MTSIIVGCPVNRREWILELWFNHVRAACEKANVEFSFAFVIPKSDVLDLEIISNQSGDRHLVFTDEVREDVRKWSVDRYEVMAGLRNQLLGIARREEPDFLLSVDSDMLLHEDAIANLIETYESNDCIAVGGKAHLDISSKLRGTYAKWTGSTYHRPDFCGVSKVDILMAIKLMGPQAYAVDYESDRQGEDFGWSKAASKNGKLFWDGRICNKHCMRPKDVSKIDPRCGF